MYLVEAQVRTEDDHLRDRIKTLSQRDVLILEGDQDNSLGKAANLRMQSHLSCIIMPDEEFQSRQE